ncbi:hypothetical protein [Prochlorococcus marinus]|nr:hypothetical protein [Prochlorococcus marinus]
MLKITLLNCNDWRMGENLIVAVISEQYTYVLSYRPSLLDPSFM